MPFFREMRQAALLLSTLFAYSLATGQTVPGQLPRWTPGTLDIHHIQTGRGNVTFFILPDGGTLLFDAGDVPDRHTLETEPTRPNDTRSAAGWIAEYIRRFGPPGPPHIDAMLVSHYHDDHVGAIPELAKLVPITALIDRGDYPKPSSFASVQPYLMFRAAFGEHYSQFQPGRVNQFIGPDAQIEIRNLAGDGQIWSGEGETAHAVTENLAQLSENNLSLAIRLRYGAFTYYCGGDLGGVPLDAKPAAQDMETPVSRVTGPVDVAVLNHHGWLDTTNTVFLQTLKPNAVIVPAWHASHPDHGVVRRLLAMSKPRPDIYVTSLLPAPQAILRYLGTPFQSTEGHIVVRVKPGGAEYQIFVLDDLDEKWPVKQVSPPHQSQRGK